SSMVSSRSAAGGFFPVAVRRAAEGTAGASAFRFMGTSTRSRPSPQILARVGDDAVHGAGGHGQRAGQEDARLLVAHAAGEVAVGRADAAHRAVEPAERVAGPAQAG